MSNIVVNMSTLCLRALRPYHIEYIEIYIQCDSYYGEAKSDRFYIIHLYNYYPVMEIKSPRLTSQTFYNMGEPTL